MRKTICFVVAVPGTAQSFLRDHIRALSEEYDIYLVGNIPNADSVKALNLKGWHCVGIERGISLFKDIKAVWQAFRYFHKMKFDAVHSVTPKAGLVTSMAAIMAGIKHRTHIFTGQVWATRKGIMRRMLKIMDKIIVKFDNHILVDGKSQRAFLEKEGVLKHNQALVFGEGSISGVNTHRFVPNIETRNEIRNKLRIAENKLVYIFLGRLNHDKGIGELYEAFNRLTSETQNVFLLLVGKDEENYVSKVVKYSHINDNNFCFYGVTPNPEEVLNAGDVFVLPTYREGFGTSVLEAACIGLPSITSDAYGVLDASVDGETGLRCKVGDVDSLYECMKQFNENRDLVRVMGENSRKRVLEHFSGEQLTQYWLEFYYSLFEN